MVAMDLTDLAARRQVLGKTAFKARFLRLVKSPKGKSVAVRCIRNLLKVAQEVSDNGGHAASKCD